MKVTIRQVAAAVIPILALCLGPVVVHAQAAATTNDVPCRDSLAARPYSQCALRFDGDGVYRGDRGDLVAEAGLFRPAQLARLVVGDSATAYAIAYEQTSRRSLSMLVAGAAVSFAGMAVGRSHGCRLTANVSNACTQGGSAAFVAAGGLLVASVAVVFHAAGLRGQARREGERAVQFHNALLSR